MNPRPEITTDPGRAVEVIRAGGLVGLPTETVYGLAADALNERAVRRVFDAKGRPGTHPLIVHVTGPAALDLWASDVPAIAHRVVELWWPGPLTVLLRRSERVLDVVTGGRDAVALRAPAHPLAQAVLERFGSGLVAPSANRFGRVSPTSAVDVAEELGGSVDLILDGGPCTIGVESTIVDLTGEVPVLLRPGKVTASELAEVIGPVSVAAEGADAIAPGMLASHYAPEVRLIVLSPASTPDEISDALADELAPRAASGAGPARVGLLAPRHVAGVPEDVTVLEPGGEPESYARVLYARLREADRLGLSCLVVVPPTPAGAGLAVADRLRRASRR